MKNKTLEVRGLVKNFHIKKGLLSRSVDIVRAVDGIDFFISEGETLGLVGESGCGKTTVGRCILRLTEPTSGDIYFQGENILELEEKGMRKLRKDMSMIFQDPFSSLDPNMKIKDIIGEPFIINKVERRERETRVLELLETVGLDPEHARRFPHQFSGGQRQRIVIARSLTLQPKFLILDEPTSSLDVSVQARIINLLIDLRNKLKLTYLFISHDLDVIEYISDKIAVMYAGKIVEVGSKKDIYISPKHPYTQALFSATPVPDPKYKKKMKIIKGAVPSPINIPSGCRFHPRCPMVSAKCSKNQPELIEVGKAHFLACHQY